MTETLTEAEIAEILGEAPAKRGYDPGENRCPHIKTDGERCAKGVMEGSPSGKCYTHSGMNSPAVRAKRQVDLLMAKYMERGPLPGDDLDPGTAMRRSRNALMRAAEEIAADIADSPLTDKEDSRFLLWLSVNDRIHKVNADMIRIGQTDRALDAAEVRSLPAWIELEDEIIRALTPFPEALDALSAALAGIAPPPALPSADPDIVDAEILEEG